MTWERPRWKSSSRLGSLGDARREEVQRGGHEDTPHTGCLCRHLYISCLWELGMDEEDAGEQESTEFTSLTPWPCLKTIAR